MISRDCILVLGSGEIGRMTGWLPTTAALSSVETLSAELQEDVLDVELVLVLGDTSISSFPVEEESSGAS